MRTAIAISLLVHLAGASVLVRLDAARFAGPEAPRGAPLQVEILNRVAWPPDPPSGARERGRGPLEDEAWAPPSAPPGAAARARKRKTTDSSQGAASPSLQPPTAAEGTSSEASDGLLAAGGVESPSPPSAIRPAVAEGVAPPPDRTTAAASRARPGQPLAWEKIGEAIRRHVVYPELARRRGVQGRTILSFVVDSSGSAREVRVVESSGHPVLDAAALAAVARAAPLPASDPPTRLVMPIVFALR